jgi:hypothetical protein
VEDHHVDRPDVEAWQRVKLTGTNRSFDLIALVAKARDLSVQSARALWLDKTEKPVLLHRSSPAWWPLQGDKTRSHPELGRQTP